MPRRFFEIDVPKVRPAWWIGAGMAVASAVSALAWARHRSRTAAAAKPLAPERCSDRELELRVRSVMEPLVEIQAMQLVVSDGVVELFGQLDEDDVDALVAILETVPGVKQIRSKLVSRPTGVVLGSI